jgi:hypothetical protein
VQPPDARVERSKEALRLGLLARLGEKPIEQITNQELVATAKVGYATFYRHYASREELLADLVNKEISNMLEVSIPVIDSGDTLAACLALCRYVDSNRAVWKVLVRIARPQLRDECIRLTALSRPKKNRDQTWIPVQLGVRIGVASTLEILSWWMEHPKQFTVESAADALNRMVVAPAFVAG